MKRLFLVACATVVLAAVTAAGGQEAARYRPDGVAVVNERLRDVILMGLQLQSRRAPVEVFVVEAIAPPTPD